MQPAPRTKPNKRMPWSQAGRPAEFSSRYSMVKLNRLKWRGSALIVNVDCVNSCRFGFAGQKASLYLCGNLDPPISTHWIVIPVATTEWGNRAFRSLDCVCLGLYSKRPEWTQPENLDALFIGISEIVDNSKTGIV